MQQYILADHQLDSTPEISYVRMNQYVKHSSVGPSDSTCSAFYKLVFKLPIEYQSNYQRNFIQQLVICLTQNPFFQYMIILSPVAYQTQKKIASKNLWTHSITYCSFQNIQNFEERRAEVQKLFRDRCVRMHNILLFLKAKYRIQTRITYWVKRFTDLLRQSEDKENDPKELRENKSQNLPGVHLPKKCSLKQPITQPDTKK